MKIRYFDHAATTPVREEVIKEMLPYLGVEYGNASVMYSLGRKAKKAMENSRIQVANALGCKPNEIYFTSCGSESDNLAIKGFAYANKDKGNHIITSKIEHHAVLDTCKTLERQGFKVTYLDVDEKGIVDLNQLANSISRDTILITIMFANNEIGTIEPIREISKIAKKHNIIFHTDAVQACGNVDIDVRKLGIDMLSLSGHKLYAPKGVGALYVKEGIEFEKFMDGGHQEKDKRGGTENVAEIVGLGKAVELAFRTMDERTAKETELRDYMISRIEREIPYCRLNGDKKKRLPNNVNFSFQFIEGESLLIMLDMKGVCASSGSACTSGSLDPSHVLLAIGLPHEIAHGSLRMTLGADTEKEDVDYVVDCLKEIVDQLRNMSPLYEDFVKKQKENQ